MPTIHLTTFVAAPVERVFDLARSIDLHKQSMTKHKEEAVAGVRFGLIEKDETVTWKARHLFKDRILKTRITEMKKPEMFTDEQAEGDFKLLKHEHHFKPCDNGTIMIDILNFESPYGAVGKGFNKVYLTRYMKKLIEERNLVIKKFAEGSDWKKLLER
ncbi:SRPBCC family protein [Terrimonas sp. NA20]|uniref:SRPBCC family protein n=1 Tax=Terrimonas ginsenosidimutans TaxID=2908004 RepID=A0ABS9KKV6_9BACT|nr:SRPBCC family protein [Terrimonas ginsenosidimutans]MCG2612955.1 SRPBCC family protein [Terrimonas ginsenosidimutans]